MRALLTLIVLALEVVSSSPARSDELASRQKREASAIYRLVLAEKLPVEQCGYSEEWDNYPVPDYVARKYLGLKLHADVSASNQPLAFEEALDPKRLKPSTFCKHAEAAAYIQKSLEGFEHDPAQHFMVLRSRGFTFPVFNATFRTAVIVVTVHEHDVHSREKNETQVRRLPDEVSIQAWVYRKTKRGWRRTATEQILIS